MINPTIYVIAGPNGIGKTTSGYDIVPAEIPIINSDEIARVTKINSKTALNLQEYGNAEAIRLMETYLNARRSFAIETNLADSETWKFLLEIQKTGYKLSVIYISINDIQTLNARIKERTMRGEHFVRPDVVEERYLAGLNLLNHYFYRPDSIQLIDNSDSLQLIAEVENGQIKKQTKTLPFWVTTYLGKYFQQQTGITTSIKDLNTIEEVKQKYLQGKTKK